MDLLNNLALGFSTVFNVVDVNVFGIFALPLPMNLILCFIGCLVGTMVGVLPGLGPIATITMLLPITFYLDPTGALIMLAGIFYGAQYGGSTSAILINMPGEVTSVVTTLDGHAMAKQGRAGAALAIAAIGSFIAGSLATVLVAAVAGPLTSLALLFGPSEYFAVMVLGLTFAVVLASGSLGKAIAMVILGVLLSTIGTDLSTADQRMTFNFSPLADGIDFAVLAMGVFGFAEVLRNLSAPDHSHLSSAPIGRLMPSREDLRRSRGPILRGSLLGSLLGVLPGGGALLGPFASYAIEKRLSKNPQLFGKGAIEGVAGPESANNAGAQTSFIPLLTLGIPPNGTMALMVGAMTIHGITPGPQVIHHNPDLFWGMIASMWAGNLMLLIINLPMVRLWVKFLTIPYKLLFPAILMFSCIGIYSIGNSPTDVIMAAGFMLAGYSLLLLGFELAPMLLGFVLGSLLEENFRRAMLMSRGDATTFVDHPLSASLLAIAAIAVVIAVIPIVTRKRDDVFVE